ncbi:MAG: sigma-54 interaction domain-containing protein [Bacteroidota bacterium]
MANYASIQEFLNRQIVISSEPMRQVFGLAYKASKTETPVLIVGESGAGKEVLARYIHWASVRGNRIFLPVNCGAIPDTLFEAQFFGYERGAFTSAFATHKGYFEQAEAGTLFLDETSEIPYHLQVKLLRVIEDKEIVRLGGEKPIATDVRIIAATNRKLLPLVQSGKFRHDLYYRIAVHVISIPPLRERKDDIKALAYHFLSKHGRDGNALADEALRKLYSYDWPGNVRELESCIIRAVLFSDGGGLIRPEDIRFDVDEWQDDDSERNRLEEALRKCGGSIKSVAKELGVHRNTVYYRIKRFNIDLTEIRKFRNGILTDQEMK